MLVLEFSFLQWIKWQSLSLFRKSNYYKNNAYTQNKIKEKGIMQWLNSLSEGTCLQRGYILLPFEKTKLLNVVFCYKSHNMMCKLSSWTAGLTNMCPLLGVECFPYPVHICIGMQPDLWAYSEAHPKSNSLLELFALISTDSGLEALK